MKVKVLVLPAILLGLTACDQMQEKQAEAPAPTTIETDGDRFSYGLGMIIGERVLKQYSDVDYELLLEGIKAQHKEQPTLITIEQATEALTAYMEKELSAKGEAAKATGDAYLQENMKKEGVQVTESGLQYSVITEGAGAKPVATDQVTVHYRGTLIDGTEFDSSYSRGEPATFGLNQVIPGWTEGLQLMVVGESRRIWIPENLAYGGRPGRPAGMLVFDVELLEIKN